MAMRRISIIQLSVVVGLVLAVGPVSLGAAYAESTVCTALKRQLVAATSGKSISQKE